MQIKQLSELMWVGKIVNNLSSKLANITIAKIFNSPLKFRIRYFSFPICLRLFQMAVMKLLYKNINQLSFLDYREGTN